MGRPKGSQNKNTLLLKSPNEDKFAGRMKAWLESNFDKLTFENKMKVALNITSKDKKKDDPDLLHTLTKRQNELIVSKIREELRRKLIKQSSSLSDQDPIAPINNILDTVYQDTTSATYHPLPSINNIINDNILSINVT